MANLTMYFPWRVLVDGKYITEAIGNAERDNLIDEKNIRDGMCTIKCNDVAPGHLRWLQIMLVDKQFPFDLEIDDVKEKRIVHYRKGWDEDREWQATEYFGGRLMNVELIHSMLKRDNPAQEIADFMKRNYPEVPDIKDFIEYYSHGTLTHTHYKHVSRDVTLYIKLDGNHIHYQYKTDKKTTWTNVVRYVVVPHKGERRILFFVEDLESGEEVSYYLDEFEKSHP